jgi:hypothetical protein
MQYLPLRNCGIRRCIASKPLMQAGGSPDILFLICDGRINDVGETYNLTSNEVGRAWFRISLLRHMLVIQTTEIELGG